MEDSLLSFAIKGLASQGPLVAALMIAIWYLKGSLDKYLNALSEERNARLEQLELRAKSCDERHAKTQDKFERLLMALAKLPDFDASDVLASSTRERSVLDRH